MSINIVIRLMDKITNIALGLILAMVSSVIYAKNVSSDISVVQKPIKPILPIFDKSELMVWSYSHHGVEGLFEQHLLFSDGIYCNISGGVGGFLTYGGNWVYNSNKSEIRIQPKSVNKNHFLAYAMPINADSTDILFLSDIFFYQRNPIFIGFGKSPDKPEEIAIFDYDKFDDKISIPTGMRYLFVAHVSNEQLSNITVSKPISFFRFDLHEARDMFSSKADIGSSNKLGIFLGYNVNGFGGDLNDDLLSYISKSTKYTISNGTVNYEFDSDKKPLTDTKIVDLSIFNPSDKENNDLENLAEFHDFCSGKDESFIASTLLSPSNEADEVRIKPVEINLQGIVSSKVDWLRPKD